MSKQISLNSAETATIRELITRYGDKITLGELLNNQDKQPIAEVNFSLDGIYDNAYELTGDSFSMSGTISYFFAHEFDSELKTEETGVPLTSVLDDDEINELADYFLGKRDDEYMIYTDVVQSREVTHEEIVEYLKTLYVAKSFHYDDTVTEF